jgi:hypothetical protein
MSDHVCVRAQATDAAMKRYAAAKLREMEQNKKNGMSDLERRMRARLANRKCAAACSACRRRCCCRPLSSVNRPFYAATAAANRLFYSPSGLAGRKSEAPTYLRRELWWWLRRGSERGDGVWGGVMMSHRDACR